MQVTKKLDSNRFQLNKLSLDQNLDSLVEDVQSGLTNSPRFLPPKYFYDERGSKLFDLICQTDEYYLTRAESAL